MVPQGQTSSVTLDPKDIAEDAVVSIDLDTLRRIVTTYNSYPTNPESLSYLRSSLAIAARRAVDIKKPLEQ